MSKLQFESLRHEISHLVHSVREPLSAKQLLPMCEMAETPAQLSQTLFAMCAADQLVKHAAPEGAGQGVKWVYGPGKVKLGATPPKTDAPSAAKADKMSSKAAPKHARAKPKTAKRRNSSPITPHCSPATAASPKGTSSGARWALTSDGAFVDLSLERGSHEIPRDRARALIEFVRLLDKAEV